MRTTKLLILLTTASLAFGMAAVKAAKPASNVPVTTSLADYDAAVQPYSVQSDGGGAYQNGVGGVLSVLLANGYNGITWGDWRLDLLANPTLRTVGISFCDPAKFTACPLNAVQPGDPGYTAPANPPWWGTQWHAVRVAATCTAWNRNMYSMKPRDRFTCPMSIRLPTLGNVFYELNMGTIPNPLIPKPETQEVQVTCNSSAADGNCNDWFIDPVPVVNGGGTTGPGQSRARISKHTATNRSGSQWTVTNEGDFYLTFHIHVTRP